MRGMPQDWQIIDFANLTREHQPIGVQGDNWHYHCILDRRGITNCAHRPLVRMGVISDCNMNFYRYLDKSSTVSWAARSNGDCGEAGNTLLWTHLAGHSWLEDAPVNGEASNVTSGDVLSSVLGSVLRSVG